MSEVPLQTQFCVCRVGGGAGVQHRAALHRVVSPQGPQEREFLIENLLVQIHFIIVVDRPRVMQVWSSTLRCRAQK